MSNPLIFTRRSELHEWVREVKANRRSLGFVPTMGALHEGHASLVTKSAAENQATLMSIFVNPKQFGPTEDFSKYPRTFEQDLKLASSAGATAIFAPTVQEMYPTGFKTNIAVSSLGDVLCGAHRKGHFDGVCTIVTLLLNLASADVAYFGMKDFQQLTIIRRMCEDLAHPTRIVGCPTIREEDGLALSSRNRYLDAEMRSKAKAVPQALAQTAKLFLGGERSAETLLVAAKATLEKAGLEPQYLELRTAALLEPVEGQLSSPSVLALAQIITSPSASCRLIDNVVLSEDEQHVSFLKDLIAKAQ